MRSPAYHWTILLLGPSTQTSPRLAPSRLPFPYLAAPHSLSCVWSFRYYQTKPRARDAAVLVLGDTAVELSRARLTHPVETGSLPPRQPAVHRQTTCPSSCTAELQSDIVVFADYMHMHHTGERFQTSHYAANGSFLGVRGKIDFWDNDFAAMQTEAYSSSFSAYTIRPGDELQTHCVCVCPSNPPSPAQRRFEGLQCAVFVCLLP